MIPGKSGEGLPSDHRNGKRPITVIRKGPNSPRVWRDLEVNLENLLPPIRNRIGSRALVRPEKAVAEAIVATRRETGTKGSGVN
jgi:hypothetical protein